MIKGRRLTAAALALAGTMLCAAPASANYVKISVGYNRNGSAQVRLSPKIGSNYLVTKVWSYPCFTRDDVKVSYTNSGKAVNLYPAKAKTRTSYLNLTVHYNIQVKTKEKGRKVVKKYADKKETVSLKVKMQKTIFGTRIYQVERR